jgi:hypothetical protein
MSQNRKKKWQRRVTGIKVHKEGGYRGNREVGRNNEIKTMNLRRFSFAYTAL